MLKPNSTRKETSPTWPSVELAQKFEHRFGITDLDISSPSTKAFPCNVPVPLGLRRFSKRACIRKIKKFWFGGTPRGFGNEFRSLSLSLFRISKRHKLSQCTSDFDETETWILQAKQRLAWQVEWQCWFCTCLPVSISRSPKERLPKYPSIFVLCEWTSSPCSNYEENVCDACGVVSSFHLTHTTSYTFTIWCAYPACRASAGIFCQEMFPLSPPGISPLGPGNMSVYHLARNENCRYLLGLDTWCLKEECYLQSMWNTAMTRWDNKLVRWVPFINFKEHSCGLSSHWEIVLVLFWIGV